MFSVAIGCHSSAAWTLKTVEAPRNHGGNMATPLLSIRKPVDGGAR